MLKHFIVSFILFCYFYFHVVYLFMEGKNKRILGNAKGSDEKCFMMLYGYTFGILRMILLVPKTYS